MLVVMCHEGRLLSTGHEDSRLYCKWQPHEIDLPHIHPPSLPKPACSTLHPDIIIVPNRNYICVTWPPRQKQSQQAVSTPIMAVRPFHAVTVPEQ